MWVVMKLVLWTEVELESTNTPLEARIAPPGDGDGEIGYLPVYEVYEAALAYAKGDATIVRQIGEIRKDENATS